MSDPIIKQLSSLIRSAYTAELNFIQTVSMAERDAQGTFEKWAPKDTLAHTTYWRRRAVESLAYHARNQQPPDHPDYNQMNREVFFEKQSLPLKTLIREAEDTVATLVKTLERFEGSDLTDPQRYPWREGHPLISYVIGNGYIHVIAHLSMQLIQLGDRPAAERLQEQALQEVAKVDNSPENRGLLLYDLACLYATTGAGAKAIEKLSEAFTLRPDLVAWSKQDPDLDSIRDDPAYQTLIAG